MIPSLRNLLAPSQRLQQNRIRPVGRRSCQLSLSREQAVNVWFTEKLIHMRIEHHLLLARHGAEPEKPDMRGETQASDAVLLVRPAGFGFHAEAAASNVFAHSADDLDLSAKVLSEFAGLAQRLEG